MRTPDFDTHDARHLSPEQRHALKRRVVAWAQTERRRILSVAFWHVFAVPKRLRRILAALRTRSPQAAL